MYKYNVYIRIYQDYVCTYMHIPRHTKTTYVEMYVHTYIPMVLISQEVLKSAQNILSFMKSNCTQEGHTYWLFRRRDDDVVKLYDITTLMGTDGEVKVRRGGNYIESICNYSLGTMCFVSL